MTKQELIKIFRAKDKKRYDIYINKVIKLDNIDDKLLEFLAKEIFTEQFKILNNWIIIVNSYDHKKVGYFIKKWTNELYK